MSLSTRRETLSVHRSELMGKQKANRCNIPSTRQWLYSPAEQDTARPSRRAGVGVSVNAGESDIIRRSSL